jgi:uncharacterized OB-fold protein
METAQVADVTDLGRVTRPDPLITDDNEFFWAAATESRLVAQRCGSCGRLRHPPRPMCPHCHSLEVEIQELSGRGTVYSYAILRHPPNPAFEYPVLGALVDLEEGVRLLTNLQGVEPSEIRIGMVVTGEFVPTVGGQAVPVFRPVSS